MARHITHAYNQELGTDLPATSSAANQQPVSGTHEASGPQLHPMFDFWATSRARNTLMLHSYIRYLLCILVFLFLLESVALGVVAIQGLTYRR
jgi:hypothetical protein